MNTLHVTQTELAVELLKVQAIKGMNMFASILQTTQPKALVKNRITKEKNPYNQILKQSYVSILLNSDYETAVVNQLDREGKEESDYKKGVNTMPIDFGTNPNNYFIGTFNGKFVLQYRPNDNIKPKVQYFADGQAVDKKEVENYLPTTQAATNQGTEREIFWRKLYLTNIDEITFNGTRFVVLK